MPTEPTGRPGETSPETPAEETNPASAAAGEAPAETKDCPFCGERIKAVAVKCRFCGEFLQGKPAGGPAAVDSAETPAPAAVSGAAETATAEPVEIWHGQPSLATLAGAFLKCLVLLAIVWLLFFYPLTWLAEKSWVSEEMQKALRTAADAPFNSYRHALGLLLTAATAGWLLVKAWVLRSVHYRVTSDRLEHEHGLLGRRIDNIQLFRVKDLYLNQSVSDRLLGIGSIALIGDNATDPEFTLHKVRDSRRVYDLLKEAVQRAARQRGVVHVE